MAKSSAKKIERLEEIIMGAGFLLSCVKSKYGNSLSDGMLSQLNSCIRDCNQVTFNAEKRKSKMEKL